MPFVAMIYVTTPDQARQIRERYSSGDAGRIVGIYALPVAGSTPTCTGFCKDGGSAFTRDHKNGHMVHACGRRHRDWRKRIRLTFFDMFGRNRLPRDVTPAMFQNPEGW
jgi:hypothetical protein